MKTVKPGGVLFREPLRPLSARAALRVPVVHNYYYPSQWLVATRGFLAATGKTLGFVWKRKPGRLGFKLQP